MPSKQVEDVYNAMTPEERANWGRRRAESPEPVAAISRLNDDLFRAVSDARERAADMLRYLSNMVRASEIELDDVRAALPPPPTEGGRGDE